MANFKETLVNGSLEVLGKTNLSASDVTGWHKIEFTGSTNNYMHVRTPLRAHSTHLGWNPCILQVTGQVGNSGQIIHDFKALVNTNGYTEDDFYGSQIPVDVGTGSEPFVYQSTNAYGGYKRVCFSVKQNVQEQGYLYIRWFNQWSAINDYPWGYNTSNNNQGEF